MLTDYMMAGMNGVEVCRQIRLQPELANVPVVVLSAAGKEVLGQAARLAGVTAYSGKPIAPANCWTKSGG